MSRTAMDEILDLNLGERATPKIAERIKENFNYPAYLKTKKDKLRLYYALELIREELLMEIHFPDKRKNNTNRPD